MIILLCNKTKFLSFMIFQGAKNGNQINLTHIFFVRSFLHLFSSSKVNILHAQVQRWQERILPLQILAHCWLPEYYWLHHSNLSFMCYFLQIFKICFLTFLIFFIWFFCLSASQSNRGQYHCPKKKLNKSQSIFILVSNLSSWLWWKHVS